jgi:general secretion pathway protein J
VNCGDRGVRGFTLIELVVAITILGLLAAVVSSGLRTELRAWSRATNELDDIRASQVRLGILRHQIQGAIPVVFSEGVDPALRPAFKGDATGLRLISRSSFRDGLDGVPRWIEYNWESNGNSRRLMAKEFAIIPPEDAPASEALWQGVVLEGADFRFEYLPQRVPNQPLGWVQEWPESKRAMPSAIRVSYVQRGQSHQMVMPLTYAENTWRGQWMR